MKESTDFSYFSFPPNLEETPGIGLDPASYRLENCFVDVPNLSIQMLQKYILKESLRTRTAYLGSCGLHIAHSTCTFFISCT